MIIRGYFSHNIPPSGYNVFSVLDSKGYCYAIAGENIGWNNYPDNVATGAVHRAFMKSPGHRANILGKKWDVIGIGAYKGPTGKKMWTVIFADKCGKSSGRWRRPAEEASSKTTPKPKPKATPKPTPKPTPKSDAGQDDAAATDRSARAVLGPAARTRTYSPNDADGRDRRAARDPARPAPETRSRGAAGRRPRRRRACSRRSSAAYAGFYLGG